MRKRLFVSLFGILMTAFLFVMTGCHKEEHTHEFTETISQEPTCTETGIKLSTCECGLVHTTSIAPLGHNEVTDAAVAATCTTDGLTEGKHCERCGEVLIPQLTLKATGHTWGAPVTNPEAGHVSNGVNTYTCLDCGATYTQEVPATGHDVVTTWTKDETSHWHACSCGAIVDKAEHTWSSPVVIKEATCSEEGLQRETCSICGYQKDTPIAKVEHTPEMVNGSPVKTRVNVVEATCVAEGSYDLKVVCKDCGEQIGELEHHTIPVAEHTYGAINVKVPATCMTDGVIDYYECSVCQKKFDINKNEVTSLVIEKGPQFHHYIDKQGLLPTCTEPGYTSYKECEYCGDIINKDVVAAKGHDFGVLHPAVAPTCLVDGNIAYKYCYECESYFNDSGEKIDTYVINHSEEFHHYLGKEGLNPTCTAAGYTPYTECEYCGNKVGYEELPMLEHKYGELVPAVAPTCLVDGNIAYYHCSECSKYFNESKVEVASIVDPKGPEHHNYQDKEGLDPTCTENGYTAYKQCSYCGQIINKETIPATGHTYSWNEEVPATCLVDGVKGHYECSVCSKVFNANKEEVTAASLVIAHGPAFHNLETIEAVPATCTETGIVAHQHCLTCDKYFINGEEVLQSATIASVLGHDYGTLIPAVTATCKVEGVAAHYVCSRCNCVFDENKVLTTLKDLSSGYAEHNWQDRPEIPATCIAQGYSAYKVCSNCGTVEDYEILPIVDHTYGQLHAAVAPKCNADGNIAYYQCSVCNAYFDENKVKVESVVIKASELYHHYIDKDGLAATCTTDGYTAYQECEYCNDVIGKTVLPKLAHNSYITHNAVAATCLADGNILYYECNYCGVLFNGNTTYTAAQVVIAKGPDYHNWVAKEGLNPTCTAAGYTPYSECSYCGEIKDKTSLDMIAHNKGEKLSDPVAATCTTEGSIETYKCTGCGQTIDVNGNVVESSIIPINPEAHNYMDCLGLQATCTTDGFTDYKECLACGNIINKEVIPAINHANKVWHSSVLPACEAAGNIAHYSCPNCNKYFDELMHELLEENVIIPATGHTYGELVPAVAPKCNADGNIAYYQCSACNKYFNSEKVEVASIVDPKGPAYHNWEDKEGLAPTCEEDGYSAYKQCSYCGEIKDKEDLPTYGHTYGKLHPAVAAKCNADGNIAYYQCSVCNKYFNDYYEEINENEITIPMSPVYHVLDEIIGLDPTCETDGYTDYQECQVCGAVINKETIPATGHTYGELHPAVAPTCTTDGNIAYYQCSVCTQYFNESKEKVATIVVPKSDEYHDYEDVEEVAATCGAAGHSAYQECKYCHDKIGYEEYPALEHNFVSTVAAQEATCISDGNPWYQYCDQCEKYYDINEVVLESIVIPASDEYHSFTINHEKLDPTCTDAGHTAYTECEYCHALNGKTDLPANGHTYGDLIPAVAPKCNEDGTIAYYQCSVCSKYFNENKVEVASIVDPKGDAYHNYVDQEGLAATCTEAGYTAFKKCSYCGVEIDKEEIPALTHSYQYVEGTTPTCLANGVAAHYECSRCLKYFDTDYQETTLVALTTLASDSYHDYENVTEELSTCIAQGHSAYTVCKYCGDTQGKVDYELADHTYGDLIPEVAPKCFEDGMSAHYVCSVCHQFFTEGKVLTTEEALVLEQYGEHNLVDVPAKDPTCTEGGYASYKKCSRCDYEETHETLNPKGHTLGELHPAVAPTCKEDGNIAYYQCSACNKYLNESEEVVATIIIAHSDLYHSYKSVAAKDSTCTEKGYTAYQQCEYCGNKVGYEEVDELGHDYGTIVVAKEATCSANGNIAYYKCSRCNEYFNSSLEPIEASSIIIPKDGNLHVWIDKEAKPATCLEKGYTAHKECSVCHAKNEDYEELELADHNYGTLVPAVTPTCMEDGAIAYYQCSVCNKYFNETKVEVAKIVIDASDDYHSYADKDGLAATCTQPGYTAYKQCIYCNKIINKTEIPALGHDLYTVAKREPTCTVDGLEAYQKCNNCTDLFNMAGEVIENTAGLKIDALDHDYSHTEAVAATCLTAGNLDYYKCNRCSDYFTFNGEVYTETTAEAVVIAALGHLLGDLHPAVAATCNAKGNVAYYDCSRCGKYVAEDRTTVIVDITTPIDETKHIYSKVEAKAATCQTVGNVEHYTCSTCGGYFLNNSGIYTKTTAVAVQIPTVDHDYGELIPEVAARCEIPGVVAHYQCSWCKKLFVYEGNQYVEKTSAELAITALEHDYGTLIAKVEPQCTVPGAKAHYICSLCSGYFDEEHQPMNVADLAIEPTGHTYTDLIPEVAAQAGVPGMKAHYECENCDLLFVKLGDEYITTPAEDLEIAALAHNIDVYHEYQAPTCTVTGVKLSYYCRTCNKYYEDLEETKVIDDVATWEVIPVVAHTKNANPVINQKNGVWVNTYTCTVCTNEFDEAIETTTVSTMLSAANGTNFTNAEFTILGFASSNDLNPGTAQYLFLTDGTKVVLLSSLNKPASPAITVSGLNLYINGEEFEIGDSFLASELTRGTNRYVGLTANTTLVKGEKVDINSFNLSVDVSRNMNTDISVYNGGYVYKYTATEANPVYMTQSGNFFTIFGSGSDGFSPQTLAGNSIDNAEYAGTRVGSAFEMYRKNLGNQWFLDNFGATYSENGETLSGKLNCANTPIGTYAFTGTFYAVAVYKSTGTYTTVYILPYKLDLAPIYNYGNLVVVKDATCTEDGALVNYYFDEAHNKYFNESFEEITKEEAIIPATGHSYSDLVAEVAATSDESGMMAHYRCLKCEAYFVYEDGAYVEVTRASLIIPALDHVHNYNLQVASSDAAYKEPTLHTVGIYYYTCSCGAVNYSGETWEDVESASDLHTVAHVTAKAAKCEEDGNIEFWHCEECNLFWEAESLEEKDEIQQTLTVIPMLGHAYVKYTFVEALSSNKVAAGDSFIVLIYQQTQALGTAKNGSKRALVDFDINNPDLTNIEVFKVRAGYKSGYLQFVQRNGYLTKAGTTKLAWNQDNYDASVASHYDFQIQYKTASDGSTYEYFSSRSSRDATILNRASDGFSLSSGYGSYSKIMKFVAGSWTDTGSYVTASGYYTCTREGCGCHLDKTGAKIA